jgi:hypothetical protein
MSTTPGSSGPDRAEEQARSEASQPAPWRDPSKPSTGDFPPHQWSYQPSDYPVHPEAPVPTRSRVPCLFWILIVLILVLVPAALLVVRWFIK